MTSELKTIEYQVCIQLFTKCNTTRSLFIVKSKNNLSVCWFRCPPRARARYANLTSDPVHLVIPYHYMHTRTYVHSDNKIARVWSQFLEFDGIICNLQKLFIKTLLRCVTLRN